MRGHLRFQAPPWRRPPDSTKACRKLNRGMFKKSLAELPTAASATLLFGHKRLLTFHGSLLSDQHGKKGIENGPQDVVPPTPGSHRPRPPDSTRACQQLNRGMFAKSLTTLPTAAPAPLRAGNEMLLTFHGSLLSDKHGKKG